MRKGKKIIAMLLALLVFVSGIGVDTFAMETAEEVSKSEQQEIVKFMNPLYSDVIKETSDDRTKKVQISDVETINSKLRNSVDTSQYLDDIDDVAAELREQMKERQNIAIVYMQMDEYDEGIISDHSFEIFNKAMEHTGVPTEGDYLKFVWETFGCNIETVSDGEKYYSAFTYEITYFTDLQQEEELNTAINKLKNELNLEGKSDYEIVKGIYDYLIRNVRYDYVHLEDATYKLKYTAYAALMNKTAVCQGYAVLFYRLALEYDIDARVITGISHEESHSWNIVKVGAYYYNVDATWDAETQSYDYFLKCNSNFTEHMRDEEYCSGEFSSQYIIDDEDYKAAQMVIENEGFVFTVENNEAMLSEYKGVERVVTIPEIINGYLVTKIGNKAFYDNDVLEKVFIPKTVRVIEDGPVSVEYGAFSHCENLLEVVFADESELIHIGQCAFAFATALEKIIIPNHVEVLGLSSFERCRSLQIINLPEGLKKVQQNALAYTGITKLHIPSTCVSYNMWIFIPTLEEITVAEGNPMYRSHEGVLYCMEEDGWQLLQYPFSKKEETYRVADFATSIYADNLGHDEEGNELLLKKLYIGDCYGVSFDSECSISKVMCSVIPDATNPYYKLENNILLSKDGKIVEQIPKYITGTLTIPEGVEKIVCYAGEHMKMQEIVFPKSLKVIGGMAFAYCHSLEKISLPDNLEIVENRAFMNCEKLDNVTIPGEVTELTELVFGWCEGLTRLAIPSNVKKIDDEAFVNCISLKEVYYGGTEEEWLQLNADREYGYYSAQIMFNMDHLCEHNFEWKVDVEATETITGLKHEECTICGYKQNEGTEIDKLSPCHEMERVELVQQTCEEDGNIEYFKCTICDKCFLDMEGTQEIAIEDTILKATGHSWDDGGVKVPTCTEGGYTIYTCSCGETYITDEVTATGHKYVDGVCSVCGENDPNFTKSSFVDVKEDKWYTDAVLWASENGYVAGYEENDGTLTFRPNNKATRAESVTFLWRIDGEAEPDEETENPFTDIKEGKWYYEEVLWAYENKVTVGYEEVDGTFTFRPDNNCTRAEILAFICRVKGNPEASEDVENPFTDIKDSKWYYNDVMWAVEQGIVSGYEETDGTFTFRPNDLCTRAEIVQMLYRAFADTE